jgi:hypothetical protein
MRYLLRRIRWVIPVVPVLILSSVVTLPGCDEAAIQTYRAQRQETRLLGIMIPTESATWFVKMMGSADAVAENQSGFDKLVHSLHFNQDKLEWTLPEGWKTEHSKPPSNFTLRTDSGMAVTITELTLRSASDRLANINRWRGQVGLKPLKAGELDKLVPPTEIAGVKTASFVDLLGSQSEAIMAEGPAAPIEFVASKGWRRGQIKISDQYAVYQAGDDSGPVSISISRSGGDGGGLDMNLARWGRQIELQDSDQIKKLVLTIKVGGETASRVDMTGPSKQRIVAVVCSRGEMTWFFKMMGPEAAVETQRPAFDEMLKSVRFAAEE